MKKIFICLIITAFMLNVLSGCSENEAIKDDLIGTWGLRQGDVMDMTGESSGNINVDGLIKWRSVLILIKKITECVSGF